MFCKLIGFFAPSWRKAPLVGPTKANGNERALSELLAAGMQLAKRGQAPLAIAAAGVPFISGLRYGRVPCPNDYATISGRLVTNGFVRRRPGWRATERKRQCHAPESLLHRERSIAEDRHAANPMVGRDCVQHIYRMAETIGILAAALNTTLGGLAVGVTRYVISATDPITLAAMRFGVGALILLPFALMQIKRWPNRLDLPGVVGLALLYFALYPVLFNAALIFTTAVRGALALSTAPLLTLVAAAILTIEPLTLRKTFAVLIATLGVAVALVTGLESAPEEAWRGDILMVGAALCSAFYSVWSRAFIKRSGAVPYTVLGMMVGAMVLAAISWWQGGSAAISTFGSEQWAAVAYLGVLGCQVGQAHSKRAGGGSKSAPKRH
jgi:drug/metabolite transporter (DMT)-like permease